MAQSNLQELLSVLEEIRAKEYPDIPAEVIEKIVIAQYLTLSKRLNHRFFDFIRTDIRCSHLTLENLGQKQDVRFTRAVVSMPAVEPKNRRIETRFIPESERCPVNWTAFLLHYKWNQG